MRAMSACVAYMVTTDLRRTRRRLEREIVVRTAAPSAHFCEALFDRSVLRLAAWLYRLDGDLQQRRRLLRQSAPAASVPSSSETPDGRTPLFRAGLAPAHSPVILSVVFTPAAFIFITAAYDVIALERELGIRGDDVALDGASGVERELVAGRLHVARRTARLDESSRIMAFTRSFASSGLEQSVSS